MSKNIVIQEGGVGKQFTADKLKTNLVGGGTCLWVPEDETQLGTKTITENGTYRASDDGYYGYSEVTVSGIGSVTGRDPDTGEEVEVHTGPDGEIVETVIPSAIRVITPPTNPYGVYADGQTITTDGMVVKAYLASGDEYGTVPNNEITLNPSVADFSQTSGNRQSEYSGFGQGPWPQPINNAIGVITGAHESGGIYYPDYIHIELDGSGYIALRDIGHNNYDVLICGESPVTGEFGNQIGTEWPHWRDIASSHSYTYNNKTVYYGVPFQLAYAAEWSSGLNLTVDGDDLSNAKAAWAIVYGSETQAPNAQTITVSWPRPGDGKVLETTFEILVAPPYSPDDN